jgi:hypothetical protein
MCSPQTSSVECDTVLVLGAGASRGARADMECRPPLGTDLAAYLLRWLEVNEPPKRRGEWRSITDEEGDEPDEDLWDDFDELRPVLEKSRYSGTPDGFERGMVELASARNVRLLGSLNRIMTVAFLGGKGCAFLEGEDLYDRLFRALGTRLRAIVTPNYDLLAEEALRRAGASYCYGGTTDSPAPIAVYKIHGSVNFAQVPGAGGGAKLEIAQRNAKTVRAREQQAPFPSTYNDHPLYAIGGSHRNVFLHQNDGRYRPVIVTYGPAKPAVCGLPYLERIRDACMVDFRSAPPARVIAVGIRPPLDASGRDDPTWMDLCRLMMTLRSSKAYWSGGAAERGDMARFGFVGREGWFADLVESVESGKE